MVPVARALRGVADLATWSLLAASDRARLNDPVDTYWTPAHHAVEHGNAETLARLLVDGADPNEVFGNVTLLTHAIDAEGDGALQSGTPLTVDITAILLAFGADPELPDPTATPRSGWP